MFDSNVRGWFGLSFSVGGFLLAVLLNLTMNPRITPGVNTLLGILIIVGIVLLLSCYWSWINEQTLSVQSMTTINRVQSRRPQRSWTRRIPILVNIDVAAALRWIRYARHAVIYVEATTARRWVGHCIVLAIVLILSVTGVVHIG